MVEEIRGEFRIVGYVDDIEDAILNAEQGDMPNELIKDLNDIHGDIIELEPYLVVQEDYDQLSEAVEEPINRLVTKCRSKDEKGAAEVIKELKANVERLSKSLME